jgi:hypothetical protein
MPTIQENIDFISKSKWFTESNITNMLLSNLFNITFNFSSAENDIVNNTKLLDILLPDTTLNNLEFNVANLRMPAVSTDYDTVFYNNKKFYANYRDDSDVLTLGFFEDAELNIRTFFKWWIDLTLISSPLYPFEYDCKELKLYPISGKYESKVVETYTRIHPISVEDKTFSFTDDVTVPVIAVSFVYKSYDIIKITE